MNQSLQSGKLRNLITIQQRIGAQDATGQEQQAWTKYSEAYASIEGISGQERMAAQQLFAEANIRMRMRYLSGVTPKMRVSYSGLLFDIGAVIDPDGRKRQLELLCVQRPEAK